jgi:hypothetical protein
MLVSDSHFLRWQIILCLGLHLHFNELKCSCRLDVGIYLSHKLAVMLSNDLCGFACMLYEFILSVLLL